MYLQSAAVPIPAVAAASVSHSAAVLTAANWVSFDFNVAYSSR